MFYIDDGLQCNVNTVKCNDYGTCGINIKQAEKDESLNSISNGTI